MTNIVSDVFEGVAKGATKAVLSFLSTPKETPPALVDYKVEPMDLTHLMEELTWSLKDIKDYTSQFWDGHGIWVLDNNLRRYPIMLRMVDRNAAIRKNVNPQVDRLHVKNRSAMWKFGTEIEVGSQIYQPYQNFMHIVDSLSASGRCRIYSFVADAHKCVKRATVTFITGELTKPEFFTVAFVCDSYGHYIEAPEADAPQAGNYVINYDFHGRLKSVVKLDHKDFRNEFVRVEIKYLPTHEDFHYDCSSLEGSEIPPSVQSISELDVHHGRFIQVEPSTGKTVIMYNCTDVHNRAVSVTIAY